MRVFRYKREKTFGTHDFYPFQVYVCQLSDLKGNIYMGIAVLPSDGMRVVEVPFTLTKPQVQEFVEMLRGSIAEKFPQSFHRGEDFISRFFGLKIHLRRRESDDFYGKVSLGAYGYGQNIKVRRTSLISCVSSLEAMIADE